MRNGCYAVACWMCLCRMVCAADATDWIGKQVMPKEGCRVMDGARVVNEREITLPLTVHGERDGWLDVGPGYVRTSEVVPFADAVDYYDEIIRRNPTSDRAYNQRAAFWQKVGELDKALADYSVSIKLDPKDATAYANRGSVRNRLGDFAGAVIDYEAVIRLDAQDPWGYNGLAWLRATCTDAEFRDAQQAYELAARACRITANRSPYCLGTLAAAYAESGDYEQAVVYQRKAISLYAGADKHEFEKPLNSYLAGQPYRNDSQAASTVSVVHSSASR